jgi:ABC-type transport system involved in multi-copper enzyme maturation permease subunit
VINQVKAELLKIRSTRTTMGLLIGLIALALLFTILSGTLSPTSQVSTAHDQIGLLSFGSIAGVFAALAGVMLVTSEYRFGTIRPTFLFNPSRSRLFASKIIAGTLAGLAFGVIGEGLVYSIGVIILKSRGIPISLNGGNVTLLLFGAIVGTALWGPIGVGLGAIVPNQVGAVISLLAWGFVAENLVFGFLPSIGRFLPVHAQDAMMGPVTQHLLPAGSGTAVLVVWTIALSGIGLALLKQRDVN